MVGFDQLRALKTCSDADKVAVDALQRRCEMVPDTLLAHIALLGWQHINFTG